MVKAAEMDVPVEATILLDPFPDEAHVLDILRSHGFRVTDLGGGRWRVQGDFFELKAAKVRLENLIEPQAKMTPRSPSPSSGAISKYYEKDTRSRSNDEPPRLPSSDQHASLRSRHESFPVDADVFRYAKRLRRRDVDGILNRNQVEIKVEENGGSSIVILQGRSSKVAAGELQKLLNDLNRSLRTQEVPGTDVDQDGKALLEDIRRNRNVCGSVLVCETEDGLHLVGPSRESYEVKQRLLGRQRNPPEPTGRPSDRNPRQRSRSLPTNSRKSAERGGSSSSRNQQETPVAADVHPRSATWMGRSHSETRARKGPEREGGPHSPPGGAAGSSSAQNQEDQRGAAAAANPGSGASRSRNQSEPRLQKEPEEENDIVPRRGNKLPSSKPHRTFLLCLDIFKFKKKRKKRKIGASEE
ncbi:RNA-binding protein 43 [Stegastes partitus]|uniref:RNA-binding protein 43 n=1 Tax=Stegastes partitus TaxID=144197 RepID=A0A9Y4N5E3_9TELE|nr:PREDICTED: uncharacterized protein LOC103360136 [Stegastes partitus]